MRRLFHVWIVMVGVGFTLSYAGQSPSVMKDDTTLSPILSQPEIGDPAEMIEAEADVGAALKEEDEHSPQGAVALGEEVRAEIERTPLGAFANLVPQLEAPIAQQCSLRDLLALSKSSKAAREKFDWRKPGIFPIILVRQFYDALHELFTFEFMVGEDTDQRFIFTINEVSQPRLEYCICRLMEVLRLLDDHAYFGIKETVYRAAVGQLKFTEQQLWDEGVLKVFYDDLQAQLLAPDAPKNHDYALICELIGQTLSHADQENRQFCIPQCFYQLPMATAALNIMAELVFHGNNKGYPLLLRGYKQLFSQHLISNCWDNDIRLNKVTLQRIVSFYVHPRPELYHVQSIAKLGLSSSFSNNKGVADHIVHLGIDPFVTHLVYFLLQSKPCKGPRPRGGEIPYDAGELYMIWSIYMAYMGCQAADQM